MYKVQIQRIWALLLSGEASAPPHGTGGLKHQENDWRYSEYMKSLGLGVSIPSNT